MKKERVNKIVFFQGTSRTDAIFIVTTASRKLSWKNLNYILF